MKKHGLSNLSPPHQQLHHQFLVSIVVFLVGFSIINHLFWGTPILENLQFGRCCFFAIDNHVHPDVALCSDPSRSVVVIQVTEHSNIYLIGLEWLENTLVASGHVSSSIPPRYGHQISMGPMMFSTIGFQGFVVIRTKSEYYCWCCIQSEPMSIYNPKMWWLAVISCIVKSHYLTIVIRCEGSTINTP